MNDAIWLFWEPLKDYGTPEYIDLCLDTIKKHSAGHPVHIVNRSNLNQFIPVEIRDDVWSLPDIATVSDFIRVVLLFYNGGIWMDIDTVVFRSVQPLFDVFDDFEFFGYGWEQGKIANGIFGSRARGHIITSWLKNIAEALNREREGKQMHKFAFNFHASRKALKGRKYRHFSYKQMQPFTGADMSVIFSGKGDISPWVNSETYAAAIFNSYLRDTKYAGFSKEQLLGDPGVLGQLFRYALR